MTALFEPLKLGDLSLPNRVLMAPLTRNRAKQDGTPWEVAAKYYAQRASAGLIITEATQISAMGKGYINTPGIYNDHHINGWRKIVDAVHASGGHIFLQLWHVGRISHVSLLPDNSSPLAPSAIQADAMTFTKEGETKVSMPQAMDSKDIEETLDAYENASRCARDAGFDGVEIHSANGYLIDQFLQSNTNKRNDAYGGSVHNRIRFLENVTQKVLKVWPASRVGVRLSPTGTFNDMRDENPIETFTAAIEMLNHYQLTYLHLVENFKNGELSKQDQNIIKKCRNAWKGIYLANGGYDRDLAEKALASRHADAITFGVPFISNPDLPRRFLLNQEISHADSSTFYGGDEKGYTDYPFLNNDLYDV